MYATMQAHIRSQFTKLLEEKESKLTLGPRGPLRQSGVVLVLQSEQTLAADTPLLLLLFLLVIVKLLLVWPVLVSRC